MPILGFLKKSAANEAADRILAAAMQAARDPEFYGNGRTPDTFDGRFELATAFGVLALLRLKAAPEADRVAQVFTDKLFRLFDAGLREAGVGDLSVARRMKGLASAFYGRMTAYGPALTDDVALSEALGRNIWNDPAAPFAPTLARTLCTLHKRHLELPVNAIEDESSWITNA